MHVPLVGSTQGRDLYQVAAGAFEFRVTEYSGGVALPAHRHRHAKMSAVLRGQYTESFGRSKFECAGRTMLIKPPEATHTDTYAGPSTVCLTIDVSDSAYALLSEHCNLFEVEQITPLVPPLISRVVAELRSLDSVSSFALEGLALEIATAAARGTKSQRTHKTAFDVACEYLEANLASIPPLTEVARVAGIHPFQLRRLFHAHAGCSPARWIRSRRIDEAKRQLTFGKESIADLALGLGFSDQSHFTNAFRREVGLTPGEFRRTSGNFA